MEAFLGILCVLLAVSVVYLIWRVGQAVSRQRYEQLQASKQDVDVALAKAEQKSELLQEELIGTKDLLEKECRDRQSIERTLEGTNAYLQAQQEKFQEQKEELQHIREHFNAEFQTLANKILDEKSQKFTDLNKQNIGLLLTPLQERIKNFEEKVERSYNQESAERNTLKGVVTQLMKQSVQIQTEANNLTKALKGDSKKQGNWGEVILERVLERSGLNKGK
jgi:DNA recombination protein RmuC